MSTATPPAVPRYLSPDMAAAHREALRAVEREKTKPAHVREARVAALLRWLADAPRS